MFVKRFRLHLSPFVNSLFSLVRSTNNPITFSYWSVFKNSVGIFKQSMGTRNREGIGLSYRPARLLRLAESIPWNRFLGSLKVKKFGLRIYFLVLEAEQGLGSPLCSWNDCLPIMPKRNHQISDT
jgi:hypothetical protein